MRVLITGATGFIGFYLARFLCETGHEVYGTYYVPNPIDDADFYQGVQLLKCDIRQAEVVDSLVGSVKPQRIYHLAAQSLPTVSWKEPAITAETNIIGTINLFEAVLRHKLEAKVLVACSSAEYGFVSEHEVPVKEDHTLKPLHPYGVSKVAQDMLAYQYFMNFGVQTVRVRIFNTTGPRKSNDVCSDFAKRIADIEMGLPPVIKVGNLYVKRDITDVRDTVKGVYLALEQGEMGEVYNLCSGKAYQISDLLDIMLGLTTQSLAIEVEQALLRPRDEPIISGDNTKLRQRTGWQPTIPIERTIEDVLNFWRQRQRHK